MPTTFILLEEIHIDCSLMCLDTIARPKFLVEKTPNEHNLASKTQPTIMITISNVHEIHFNYGAMLYTAQTWDTGVR